MILSVNEKKQEKKFIVKTKRKIFSDLQLAELAEEALRKAVSKAAAAYRLAGQPMVIVRDNKKIHIPPDQIKIEEDKRKSCPLREKRPSSPKTGKVKAMNPPDM